MRRSSEPAATSSSYVYTLELQGGRYYVGVTNDRRELFDESFLRLHPFVARFGAAVNPTFAAHPTDVVRYQENVAVARLMLDHGVNNVRGACMQQLEVYKIADLDRLTRFVAHHLQMDPEHVRERLRLQLAPSVARHYCVFSLSLKDGRELICCTNDLEALQRRHKNSPSAFVRRWSEVGAETAGGYTRLRGPFGEESAARAAECEETARRMYAKGAQFVRGALFKDVGDDLSAHLNELYLFIGHHLDLWYEHVQEVLERSASSATPMNNDPNAFAGRGRFGYARPSSSSSSEDSHDSDPGRANWSTRAFASQTCVDCQRVIPFNPEIPRCRPCWERREEPPAPSSNSLPSFISNLWEYFAGSSSNVPASQTCVDCRRSIPYNPERPRCLPCWERRGAPPAPSSSSASLHMDRQRGSVGANPKFRTHQNGTRKQYCTSCNRLIDLNPRRPLCLRCWESLQSDEESDEDDDFDDGDTSSGEDRNTFYPRYRRR